MLSWPAGRQFSGGAATTTTTTATTPDTYTPEPAVPEFQILRASPRGLGPHPSPKLPQQRSERSPILPPRINQFSQQVPSSSSSPSSSSAVINAP
ncbi:hypothetical protein AND_001506 [Anopheles darlingi]|uniref:Uncharacterized protein n=1 Tax=Anopheles darlingi TaxID=43151 RepID=W5JTU2_ANODA|nr:hypothetical protein AND_001506 [Anopheles darlingi]